MEFDGTSHGMLLESPLSRRNLADARVTGLRPMESALLCRAFEFALAVHGNQVRKGIPVPFISHLMAVSALVLEHGGTAVEGAAALLHDSLEDTSTSVSVLEDAFGEEITTIVVACSDNLCQDPLCWRDRKGTFLASIESMSASALLVTTADKLHNARDVVKMQRKRGDATFIAFEGQKDGTLWYYGEALKALEGAAPGFPGLRALVGDLRREVAEMFQLAGV
jgi:(p)ppGpp synthase/HD superfamily hydrolase